jgi:Fe-S oxidoreductase
LSHYYQNRLRPRHAYAMGWINLWAWAASPFPEIANFMTQAPGLNAVAKLAGGVAPERQMPRFARQTFQSWFRHRPRHNPDGPKVLLWADTFNNYFHPAIAAAATEVLEAAGYRVIVPAVHLCCGRPLYDYGFLDMATSYLRRILSVAKGHIKPALLLSSSSRAALRCFATS